MLGGRVSSRKHRAEDENHNRGHDERKKRKAVAREIAELLANHCRNLRRQRAQMVWSIICFRDGPRSGARGRSCFTQFFTAMLLGIAHPKETAEHRRVNQKSRTSKKDAPKMSLRGGGNRFACKGRRKP